MTVFGCSKLCLVALALSQIAPTLVFSAPGADPLDLDARATVSDALLMADHEIRSLPTEVLEARDIDTRGLGLGSIAKSFKGLIPGKTRGVHHQASTFQNRDLDAREEAKTALLAARDILMDLQEDGLIARDAEALPMVEQALTGRSARGGGRGGGRGASADAKFGFAGNAVQAGGTVVGAVPSWASMFQGGPHKRDLGKRRGGGGHGGGGGRGGGHGGGHSGGRGGGHGRGRGPSSAGDMANAASAGVQPSQQ